MSLSLEARRKWIDPHHRLLSISRQCCLAGLPRSSYYYEPEGRESPENLRLMQQIDKLYLRWPFYGSPRMTDWLQGLQWRVNEKRVARLMQLMGLQATLPGSHTSRPHPQHPVYPYLLRGLRIEAPDQVWCADITYLPLQRAFLYLMAVMDWYSRYVLSWELSNTLEAGFCLDALNEALGRGSPGDLQYRPGGPVHERGVHRTPEGRGDPDQHGRKGAGPGQCVHRAVVAERQV